jgi:4-hydroxy-tetrahydrodipicolinate synthase
MPLDPAAAAGLAGALATAVAVPVTPLRPSGQADWDAHAQVIRRLADGGITVITPNGNTGEFYALGPSETARAVESAVAAAEGRSVVMAGVGLDIATAVGAARHAARAGARMVMVHQPPHPYVSAEGWTEYHAAIAAAVPGTGIVLYVRNPRIGGADIGRLADRCPNVIGVKYAVPDVVRFAGVARDAGLDRLTWLAGSAELAAPGYWAVGARGFTSGLANVAPALSLEMLDALRGGDFPRAMKVWEAVRPFEELRAADSSADNVSVVKQALAQLGVCGADVRPPSRPLPAAVRTQISAILASWGLTGARG